MQITLDVSTGAALSAAFVRAPQVLLDELEKGMGSAVAYLLRETQEGTPTAMGTLRRSFIGRVDVMQMLDAVFGTVSSPLPYAVPVELGTKPHHPPLEPLITWAEVKLGLQDDEAEAAALAIQRKIGRVGTPGYGMAHFALADGHETIRGEIGDAVKRALQRIGGQA
ncbi:MAG: HK97 gp10 family phage protein [Roseateles sp.]